MRRRPLLLILMTVLLLALPTTATAQSDDFSTDPVAEEADLAEPALLTAIDVSQGADADTITFTFDGDVPGYEAGYVEQAVHAGSAETGDAEPVDLAGDAILEVVLSPATATTTDGLAVAAEQQAQTPQAPAVREVVFAGEYDGATTVGVGISARTGVRVRSDDQAGELTLEVAHPAGTTSDEGGATADAQDGTEAGTAPFATQDITAAAVDFDDIASSVHADNIRRIADAGVTDGCAEDRFCPKEPVTRAQMATFLARALDLPQPDRDYFPGDDGTFHEENINKIAAARITEGCAENRFCPTGNVDRDQMASFLARGFEFAGADLDYFTDDDGNTHEANINAAAAARVSAGCNTYGSRFCPARDVTRGQMASFLARAMGLSSGPRLLLEPGDEGGDVEVVQRRLANLEYFVGPIDGIYGNLTEQAVMAFQKLHGLSRDAIVGPSVREHLQDPEPFNPRSDTGTWMELDETRQILVRVVDGDVREIFNTSSGTEQPYTYNGTTYLGDTPNGTHDIGYQIDGWRTSHLGRLYRPKYFTNNGHAIHGSTSVPNYPASHGCVRVSIPAMDHLWANDRLPIGAGVWVYNPYTP